MTTLTHDPLDDIACLPAIGARSDRSYLLDHCWAANTKLGGVCAGPSDPKSEAGLCTTHLALLAVWPPPPDRVALLRHHQTITRQAVERQRDVDERAAVDRFGAEAAERMLL